jgi:PAS domain S-box-containing protein
MNDRDVLDVLLDTADGAFAVDGDGRILLWNRSAESITGYKTGDVIGKSCCDVTRGRDPSGNLVCFKGCHVRTMAMRGEQPSNYDLVISHANGKKLWLDVSTVLVRNKEDKLQAHVHVFRDVTSRRELETYLRRALGERFETLRDPIEAMEKLTNRERAVLKLLASGLPTHTIAHRLSISRATVRNHTQNILNKLGVHSKLAAVALAYQHGLVQ